MKRFLKSTFLLFILNFAFGWTGVGAAVPGMIEGFKSVGNNEGWIVARKYFDDKAVQYCSEPNHMIRMDLFSGQEDDIFKYVTGMKRSDFEKQAIANKLKVFKDAQVLPEKIEHEINGTKREDTWKANCGTIGPKNFQCGTINLYKLGDLLKEKYFTESGNKDFAKSGNPASFNIIYYHISDVKEINGKPNFEGRRLFRKFADVGALQARSENKDAVFQLASRPNCLEGGRAYRGEKFDEIMGTFAVQGEESASSAFPGGFARMFCEIPTIGQDEKVGNNGALNLFKYTSLGKFVTAGGDIQGYTHTDLEGGEDWCKKLLICFHEGIAVTTGFTCVHRPGDLRRDKDHKIDYNSANCNEKVDKPNDQLINQVPVCALNLKGFFDWKTKQWEKTAGPQKKYEEYSKQLLKAFYKGTILSSVMHKKYKIILTLVGGSAFQNDISWIVEAIMAQEEYIKKYGLTVFVVFLDWPSDPEKKGTPANKRQPLYKMVERIGGNTLEFKINETSTTKGEEWVEWNNNKATKSYTDPNVFEHYFKTILQRIVNPDDQKKFFGAVTTNNLAEVNNLIPKVDINNPDADGNTPLILAVGNGIKEIAELLLASGADKDKANSQGKTPLTIAQEKGFKEIVALLQPAAPAGSNQLKTKLGILKTNLGILKNKLEQLKTKLDVLKGKLGAKAGAV